MNPMNTLMTHTLRWGDAIASHQRALVQQLDEGVDLSSREGIEGALLNILTISLVAAIAALVLFVLGPRIIQLGTDAVNRVQAPPW